MKKCPICSNNKIFFSYKINQYFYYKCEKCQTLFLNPFPLNKEINNYYQNNFNYSAGIFNKEKILKQAKRILKNLKKLNKKGKKLLDIGCGYGHFLNEAKKFNFFVEGIEPSKKLFNNAIKNYSLNISNFSFNDYFKVNYNKRFDFITMIHVIEHIKNPIDFIKMASLLLNEDGILYIETPHLNSHLYNFEKENYTFLTPPDHLWVFSLKSIKTMKKKLPFLELIKINTYSYPEHFMGIIKSFKTKNEQMIKKYSTNKKLTIEKSFFKKVKNFFLDHLIARIFTPILNINNKGSILEVYLKKN